MAQKRLPRNVFRLVVPLLLLGAFFRFRTRKMAGRLNQAGCKGGGQPMWRHLGFRHIVTDQDLPVQLKA